MCWLYQCLFLQFVIYAAGNEKSATFDRFITSKYFDIKFVCFVLINYNIFHLYSRIYNRKWRIRQIQLQIPWESTLNHIYSIPYIKMHGYTKCGCSVLINNIAQQNKKKICTGLKIWYFEDFFMLNPNITFILLCKLQKRPKMWSNTPQMPSLGIWVVIRW